MDRIKRIVLERLERRGLDNISIHAYIRDLLNTLEGDAHLSLYELNGRLQLLGWSDLELDDQTLQLIMVTSENHGFPGLIRTNPFDPNTFLRKTNR